MTPYNVKLIEYADGNIQVKCYKDTIKSHRRKSRPLSSATTLARYDPIPITWEEAMERAKQTEKELEQKKEYSLRSSVSRTRTKIEQLARSGDFKYFVTLTYDPKKVDRYDYDECIKTFYVWLNNIKRKAPELQALFIPEFHLKNAQIDDNGEKVHAIHFHGLMGQIDGLEVKYKRSRNGQKVYSLSDWHFGISDVTKIENPVAICRYIRKYVTKQSISIARTHKNRHRYFKTGITPPKEKKLLIDSRHAEELQEEYIKRYAKENDLEIGQNMSNYSEYGYIPVKYVELRRKK